MRKFAGQSDGHCLFLCAILAKRPSFQESVRFGKLVSNYTTEMKMMSVVCSLHCVHTIHGIWQRENDKWLQGGTTHV